MKKKKLNLGCGSHTPEEWINVDNALSARLAKVPFFRIINRKLKIFNLVRLKNLAQHFGILGGILKEGVRDGKWEVSAVRVV